MINLFRVVKALFKNPISIIASRFEMLIIQVHEGKGSTSQARAWMDDFFKKEGAGHLKELGFMSRRDAINNDSLSELASSSRINLIIDYNVRCLQSVRDYKSQLENIDNFPFVELTACDLHKKLDGLVMEVNSKAYFELFPPIISCCKCYLRELDEDELEGRKPIKSIPPSLKTYKDIVFNPINFNLRQSIVNSFPKMK